MQISKPWTWSNAPRIFLGAFISFQVVIADQANLPIYKDVAILGGGASGTYAAVRLREDYGKSVLVIEQEPVLGGHVNTYTIPETGEAFNYGVQSYIDYKGAKAFFERFNIPLQPNVLFLSDTDNVDPTTGKIVTLPPAPPFSDTIAAIQKYYNIILPFNDILLPAYWNFPTKDKIPADLLLPFSEFVTKYGLEAMDPILLVVSGQSITSTKPTLYTVQNFGTPVVEGFLNNTFFDPAPFNNSLLYGDAARLLDNDVLFSSTITKGHRSKHGVSLVVENLKTGKKILVFAKTLLVAAPPSIENLGVLGLDKQEKAVFSSWSYATVYTAVLKTNLIPDNTSIAFVTPANSTAAPKPYSFGITYNGVPGYFWIIFFSEVSMTEEGAKEAIVDQTLTLYNGGAFPPIGSSIPIAEVVAISNHSTVTWSQSAKQLEAGFIQKLYALQGHKNTWYTGGLWCPDYSSNVWAFTDTVLPRLLKTLD